MGLQALIYTKLQSLKNLQIYELFFLWSPVMYYLAP